jgi:hypothetical protein
MMMNATPPRSLAHTRRRLLLGVLGLGCAVVASPRLAEAQGGGPQAEVLVIHGTQCDKPSVDPQIGEMPPLKYNCYKLIERKMLPLSKGQPSTAALPNGRTFQITYGDVTADKRYKVAAAISQPDGKGFLKLADITAEPNKRFNVGGFAYQNGALVLAIKIVP